MIAPARTNRSLFSEWWWTIDQIMLASMLVLALVGGALSLAAGPAMAQRLGYDTFHFVIRHLIFLGPAVALLILVSMLPPRHIRRLAFVILGLSFAGMILALMIGGEVKGAQRWIQLGPFALQPSEFMKPALIVTSAWLFAWRGGPSGPAPGSLLALVLYLVAASLLVMQPDIGQTILITAAWGTVFFVSGIPFLWGVAMGVLSIGALIIGYFTVPHVAARIDAFLNPGANDTHQVDTALNAIMNGGLFGQGPGEGQIKRQIPDAHTDFIFAVAAEEYGILLCLMIVVLFGFIVVRGFAKALSAADHFVQLSVAGLVSLLGLQAAINIGVTLKLLPAKGMTLPFISYGGSSMVAIALTCGMVLALTRNRASPRHLGI